MGLMCSWVAIQTEAKAEVLDHLGLIETDEVVEPTERRKLTSVYQNDNGWLYVCATDFGWADQARVLDLSRFGMTLGVQTEDKIDMECRVRAADGGRELWAVAHVNQPGQELTVSGDPPAALAEIRRKYETLQADKDDADYLWEIPLALAREVSGFRVDEDPIDFMAVVSARSTPEARGGLIARILSVFR
ncbi:MAG TPA: hypothetical protein VNT42_00455 [Sphingomonas sp.]|nr:hypothetical protein [Sphingomonas sp.]